MIHLVSAIIPVHNGEKFLAEAVESIRRQTYATLEIIIVDDGSTDGTASLVAHLGRDIRCVRQSEQRGPAAARNRGLAVSRGTFIAFLDADDVWPRDKLQAQITRLLDDPTLDVVLGRIQPMRSVAGAPLEGQDVAGPVIAVQLGSAVFRRSVFHRVGLFDESLYYSEDHDWFLRARERNIRLAVMEQVTLLYRRHLSNMTRSRDHQGYQLARVLKSSLDRRRTRGEGCAQPLPKLSDFDEARLVRAEDRRQRV